jgi:hypothetical protein
MLIIMLTDKPQQFGWLLIRYVLMFMWCCLGLSSSKLQPLCTAIRE